MLNDILQTCNRVKVNRVSHRTGANITPGTVPLSFLFKHFSHLLLLFFQNTEKNKPNKQWKQPREPEVERDLNKCYCAKAITVKLDIGSHSQVSGTTIWKRWQRVKLWLKGEQKSSSDSKRKVNVCSTFSHKPPYHIAQPVPLIKNDVKLKFMPNGYKRWS